jgi:chromosome partitioning protein
MDATRVSNLEKARENALCFAEEMMRKLPVKLPVAARLSGLLMRDAA